jgi:sodium transport system ATP-binding protein
MLEIKGLTKKFKDVTAVSDVTFTVGASEIFGLLGANGAGKTTTLRMLATMLAPTEGTAVIAGHDLIQSPAAVRKSTGLLFGGDTGLYDRLTARENIAYFAALNDVPDDKIEERTLSLAKIFDFTEFLDKWAGKLSKGTRQKVAFARAIIHNPAIMLLDEPTTGLDVTSKQNVEDFIGSCRQDGKTVILSDHNLDVIERVCDRVGILENGKLLGAGTAAELCSAYQCASLKEVFFTLAGQKSEG